MLQVLQTKFKEFVVKTAFAVNSLTEESIRIFANKNMEEI
jgi:hypothetical protein